jgi:hypothetical protein
MEESRKMFKVQDEITESALCIGIIAALIWGIGLSLYGFHQDPGQASWLAWVRGREWVLERMQPPGQTSVQQQR